jgi:hypothetical protein
MAAYSVDRSRAETLFQFDEQDAAVAVLEGQTAVT